MTDGGGIWGEQTQACLCWIAVFSLHPVFQVVVTCVHTTCAVRGIGDIHSLVLFERQLNLLSLKLLWVQLNFTLVVVERFLVVGHKVGQLWWGSKATGKVGIQGTWSRESIILECH